MALIDSLITGTRIRDDRDAVALLAPLFDGLDGEALRVLHLDADGRLLGLSDHGGTSGSVDLPVRAIVADALRFDASALLIAHNHPSGDPTPSRSDRVATKALVHAVHLLGIRVLDHLIFGGGSHSSFRALGFL